MGLQKPATVIPRNVPWLVSAAFGLLNHKVLHKVISYSIRGIVNRWFENYLFDRIQFGEISRGVPQNSILEQLIYFI